jgi:hypothetical protein
MSSKFVEAKASKHIQLLFAVALRPGQWRLFFSWVLAHLIYLAMSAQKEVPQEVMQQIYEEVKTPYKY